LTRSELSKRTNKENSLFFSMPQTLVDCLFHKQTNTCTYIVRADDSHYCAVIDPVLDFSISDGRYWTEHIDKVVEFVAKNSLEPKWILETHAHADHLTGAYFLAHKFPGANIGIGEHIISVQTHFKKYFNLEDFKPDGSQFDHLFKDMEQFNIGTLLATAIHTPGHTPDSMSYHIGDCLFSGDTLFMPDGGSARCDFPNGSAKQLYNSVTKRMYTLPEETRMFVGHDYAPEGREFKWQTTIGDQKSSSKHLKSTTTEDEFVKVREERDKTLSAPGLLIPAIQVNIRGGRLPPVASNGVSYLLIPLHKG